MTVSMVAVPTMSSRHHLLPALEAAVHASREAHEATLSHTDTVLACQHLPAEIYQYAPHLSHATNTLTAVGRAVTVAAGAASANPTPDNLYALRRATAELITATAVLRYQTAALAAAASWFSTPTALPPPLAKPGSAAGHGG
ncbi:hypothetical protein ABH935_002651 [Catenulispora sp. GAS73]|uniref:hypothetical protein n=1 Tax=Catenulispora sp. GAS73 TaxID=3156269 RepID=UPI003514DABE